jgi:hypothetical protein
MKKVGLWLALSALLVNGPRFVIIFLKVDSIDVPKPMEATLLTATGIATGLVLTGGGAYIAHALAESKARGMMRWFMVLCWFLLLIFSVVLLAPLMVAAIDDSSLKTVLNSKFSQWLWSVTSVLAVEVIAGGAMVAYALHGRVDDSNENSGGTPDIISVLTGALAQRIANSVAPANVAVPPPLTAAASPVSDTPTVTATVPNGDIPRIPEIEQALADTEGVGEQSLTDGENRKYTKHERQQLLLKELQNIGEEADLQIDVLAAKLKVSPQTIYRDLADLRKSISTDSDQ